MTMGEVHQSRREVPEDVQDLLQDSAVRRCRRNAMGDIFEGVEGAVLQRLADMSLHMMQLLGGEAGVHTACHCQDDTCTQHPSSSSSSSSDSPCCCEQGRLQRSFSSTEGEEMAAALALQNRHRRNAVGNVFDLLTLSQKLLLVEQLQGKMDDSHAAQLLCSLSSSSSPTSSGSSSSVSSPRSQGEIVCR